VRGFFLTTVFWYERIFCFLFLWSSLCKKETICLATAVEEKKPKKRERERESERCGNKELLREWECWYLYVQWEKVFFPIFSERLSVSCFFLWARFSLIMCSVVYHNERKWKRKEKEEKSWDDSKESVCVCAKLGDTRFILRFIFSNPVLRVCVCVFRLRDKVVEIECVCVCVKKLWIFSRPFFLSALPPALIFIFLPFFSCSSSWQTFLICPFFFTSFSFSALRWEREKNECASLAHAMLASCSVCEHVSLLIVLVWRTEQVRRGGDKNNDNKSRERETPIQRCFLRLREKGKKWARVKKIIITALYRFSLQTMPHTKKGKHTCIVLFTGGKESHKTFRNPGVAR